MGWRFLVSFLLAATVIFPILPADGYQSGNEGEEYGTILDVRTFSASCLLNETCEIQQPNNLIEYYSADWCEPCAQVSQQVNTLNNSDVLIIQHHPSNQDATFLSASKLRFDLEFRLLFYPSIVVDGKFLLTGTRQAMDLNETLDNSTKNFSGLESLSVSNATMEWNSSNGTVIRVWYVEPTAHTSENRIHPYLAHQSWEFNSTFTTHNFSQFEGDENGTFVVVLERPGIRQLTTPDTPTGRMEVSDQNDSPVSTTPVNPKIVAGVAALGLLILLIPALIMQLNLMKEPAKNSSFEDE